MPARIVTLLLIAVLALPASLVTPPVAATPATGAAATPVSPANPGWVVAAAKKGKKKNKPKFRTITVRRPLTQTFTNAALINVPNGTNSVIDTKAADLYPSTINVGGFANGTIHDVDLILNGFTWNEDPGASAKGHPDDADILLAAAHLSGLNAFVLSDVCGGDLVTNLTLTLDDEAAAGLSTTSPPACISGAFKPTNFADGAGADTFPPPAPTPSGNSLLSVFDGANPNGTWQLFVVDDFDTSDAGSLAAGWSLTITAEADVQVQERVKVKKDKKTKRKH